MRPPSFSYGVSRPYPWKYFTHFVLVGAIVAAILFSFLNFASSGYSLAVVYSPDPNSTVSSSYSQSKKWPSLPSSKVLPTCESVNIAVNTEFFTTNTALTYTLTGISYQSPARDQVFAPSLIYHNNFLEDCSVSSIQVLLESSDGRTATQIGTSTWGADATAYITCSMDTATTGRSTINLTASYNLAPKTVSVNTVYTGETRFIGRNQASRASLYWGESLLSLYWWQLTQNMESAQGFTDTKNKSGTLAKGGIYFTPNITLGVNITDPDFFSIGWRFIDQNLGVYWDGGKNKSISRLIHDQSSPSIWYATDRFAKILYSTVLTDLGQTSAHPNILADPALLKIFSNSTWNVTAMSEHLQELGLAIPGFNLPETPIGVPVVNPSTISTTYLCQVPRQKSAGTLIIAVLVADLVFLQALWKLANLIAGKVLARQDPTGNFCEGCLQKTDPLGTDNPRDGSVVPSKNAGMNRDEYELVGVRTTAMQ